MDNLLPHTRIIAHLSRYSLQSVTPKKFYVILYGRLANELASPIMRIALAFGCAGMIIVGTEENTVKDNGGFGEMYYVQTLQEAKKVAMNELGSQLLGVFATPTLTKGHRRSISLSNFRAFSKSTTFLFLDEDDQQATLDSICEQFVHVSSATSTTRLDIEACVSIALHQFVENRLAGTEKLFESAAQHQFEAQGALTGAVIM